jgi:subfamily B ATP-binding cassette protein MsbA
MTAPNPNSPAPQKSSFARYRRLLKYLKPAKWPFVGGILAGLIYAAASGVGFPLMLYVVAPVIFGESQTPAQQRSAANGATNLPPTAALAPSTNISATAPTAATKQNQAEQAQQFLQTWAQRLFGGDYRDSLLLAACLGMPLIFLLRGISAFLNRYWINQAGFLMLESMRTEVYCRLQELPLAFYQRYKSGDLASRLMADTEQLKNMVITISGDIFKQPFTLVGALISLLYLSYENRSAMLVLITLLSVPLCIIPIRLAAKRIIKKARKLTAETGELAAVITESLQSPTEIQAYNLQSHQRDRFTASIRSIFRLSMKTVKYQAFVSPVIEFFSACGFMAALYFGVRNGMDFPTFSAMGAALYMAYEPAKKLSNLNALWKMAVASFERLEHILDADDSVPQPERPTMLLPRASEIAFEQVGFTYQPREAGSEPSVALVDVNVRFRPGEVVALVGKSGAGKSTFIALIPRFYDPTSGRVSLGGVDIRQADKAALRDGIALVPQMPALFNTTIAENIRMGRLTATDDEVRAAAQKAFVADFINTLPQGYNTIVGERGASLSGGQRQRIAIARAFLKDAPILILDEAMSALDSESEAKVQAALQQLVQGRTTFMITHRFSSLSMATRILVFEEGCITGDGTVEELKRTHAVFRRMAELQQLK